MNKILFSLIISVFSCFFSLSIARDVLIFNNHYYEAHVRERYEGGLKSSTKVIAPGGLLFLKNYEEHSILYYLPRLSKAISGWGYLYKKYDFDKSIDPKGDALVILYPSFEEHVVLPEDVFRGFASKIFSLVSQVGVGTIASLAAKYLSDEIAGVIKEGFGQAAMKETEVFLLSKQKKISETSQRVSVKRGVHSFGYEDVLKTLGNILDLKEGENYAIADLFGFGKMLEGFKKLIREKREIIKKSDDISTLAKTKIRARDMLTNLKKSTSKLFISEIPIRKSFWEEVKLIEEWAHKADYFGGNVTIVKSERNFLSLFDNEIDSLVGELIYLIEKASVKIDALRKQQAEPVGEAQEEDEEGEVAAKV